MDNDILQDNNGNVVTPDNGVLNNEVEGIVYGSDSGSGTDPEESEPGSGSGTRAVLTPGQKIPTNREIQAFVNTQTVGSTAPHNYKWYDWVDRVHGEAPSVKENYCPTINELCSNVKFTMEKEYRFVFNNNDFPSDKQCPTADDLSNAFTKRGGW